LYVPFPYIVFERRVAQKNKVPDHPRWMAKLAAVIRGISLCALRRRM